MKILVLLNARAGTLNTGAVENPDAIVREAFEAAGHSADVRLVEPQEMDEGLDEALRSDVEAVVVGGGDGTFSRALAKLSGSGKAIGLLPLGTMNLMGRDMYADTDDFAGMAKALAEGEVVPIDLARINGKPFHTLCGLGYFSRVAREREKSRFDFPGGRLLSVLVSVWKSVTKSGYVRANITAGGERRNVRAYAVLVTSNRIGDDWRRARLDEGILEIHIMRHAHFVGRAKAGLELLSRRWREGDTIETLAAERIEVRSPRSRFWLAVDGELVREPTPLVFEIAHAALPVLMPNRSTPGTEA